MVGWHHQLNGHGFEQTLGDCGRQRSLACCMQSLGPQRVGPNLATEQQQQIDAKISLMIQWLRLCTPNAGRLGLIPGQGIRSCMPTRVGILQLKILNAASKKIPPAIAKMEDLACQT